MKDKHGNEIVDNINPSEPGQLSHEELIAKTISGVLDEQANRNAAANEAPDLVADPFDFSSFESNNNQNESDQFEADNTQPDNNANNGQYDQFGQFIPNANINPSVNPQSYAPQATHDSRFDKLSADQLAIGKRTQMNSFMMELNNSIAESPEILNGYRNAAIEEAKKSINSGEYIAANDLLSYLHGKKMISDARNVEVNPNPLDGGTDLNPSGNETKMNLDDMTAEQMVEQFGSVQF